jgi:hypothetical protein
MPHHKGTTTVVWRRDPSIMGRPGDQGPAVTATATAAHNRTDLV